MRQCNLAMNKLMLGTRKCITTKMASFWKKSTSRSGKGKNSQTKSPKKI